jgi:hypothetical protein
MLVGIGGGASVPGAGPALIAAIGELIVSPDRAAAFSRLAGRAAP